LRDKVLLERRHAEGIRNFEVGQPAIRTVGTHVELAAAAKERRGRTAVREAAVVKVAEDGLVGCDGHRGCMLRRAPLLRFRRMTWSTRLASDVRTGSGNLG
jgi:hypothetical protein